MEKKDVWTLLEKMGGKVSIEMDCEPRIKYQIGPTSNNGVQITTVVNVSAVCGLTEATEDFLATVLEEVRLNN